MKKTNKISNTSKKAIRYIALTTALATASLANKAKADLFSFNLDANVGNLAAVQTGVNVGHGINAYAGANALGVGASTGVSVANGNLVDVNADANVGSLVGAKAGVSVGDGVNAYVGANALGIGGSTGVSVGSIGSTAYAYPRYQSAYYTTTPLRPVSYASAAVVQPGVRYVQVGTPAPARVVRVVRPAPVVYQTAPVASQGERVEVHTYDSYSHESENSEFSHTIQKRFVEDQANRYREQEVHSRKVIKTRRVYYTYE